MSNNKNVSFHKINNRKNVARRSSRVVMGGPLISQMKYAQIAEATTLLDKNHTKVVKRKANLIADGKGKSKSYRNCNRNLTKINHLRNLLRDRGTAISAAA